MKYIVTRDEDGKEEVFTFPRAIDYEDMAEVLEHIKNQTYGNWRRICRKPVSVGLIDKSRKCYGNSETLVLQSRPEDTELLAEQFNLKYIVTRDEEGKEDVFAFPRTVHHDAMTEVLIFIDNQASGDWYLGIRKPVSAGFVDENWKCFGTSETLGLESRPEDTKLLRCQMHQPENKNELTCNTGS